MLWWVRKFLVKVLEFFSCVVFWVGLKIGKFVVWNVFIILIISGVFGLMMVSLIVLFWVKVISVGMLVMLMLMFCILCLRVVFVLLGVM